MGIVYDETRRIFHLTGGRTSYLIGLAGQEGFAGHLYFGRRLGGTETDDLLRITEPPYTPDENGRERVAFLESFPTEYGSHGVGDFRESSLNVQNADGCRAAALRYAGHRIFRGKETEPGLPMTFGTEDACETLRLSLRDEALGLTVDLYYTVFETLSAVLRRSVIRNEGSGSLLLCKAMSACLDMDWRAYEMITLHGGWARERHIQRRKTGYGSQGVCSLRGETGHQDQPFLALVTPQTTQESGEAYGFHLIYSGNFRASAQVTQFDQIRVNIGINDEDFSWVLEPGASFATPEAALVYSADGIGGMTRTYHDLYRSHLMRGPYVFGKRPVLLNSWEAAYFDFDGEKLFQIARTAAEQGVELFVLDDGWFGQRNDDNTSLGDWQVNEKKLKCSLAELTTRIRGLGMRFGIWVEPEMVSPDSDLYRAHPDWAIAIAGREPARCRNQYVLDLTRRDVRDYVFSCLETLLAQADISYVKWDMNRPLTDLGSAELPAERMGEFAHRYVLGVYELQERLLARFPDLLLENCSAGGARFDPGMLYYSPQIWCSDDTDAVERLSIQEGTAMLYPLSCIGAHVSACPNHTVGRSTPFFTRAIAALAGTFGYELDLNALPPEERAAVPDQIALHRRFAALLQEGDYYRLLSVREDGEDAYLVVSKDRRRALVSYVRVLGKANCRSRNLRLAGLDEKKRYRVQGFLPDESGVSFRRGAYDKTLPGDALLYAGLQLPILRGDAQGLLLELTALEAENEGGQR